MKTEANSARNSNDRTKTFPLTPIIVWCAADIFYAYFPFHVPKGQALMKLIIFPASPRIFLSETGIFVPQLCGDERVE